MGKPVQLRGAQSCLGLIPASTRLHLLGVGDCGLSPLPPGPSWYVRGSPYFLPLFLPASSSPELRKHADTTQRTRQMSGHVSPCPRPPSDPHVTHILTAAASTSLDSPPASLSLFSLHLCLLEASSVFLEHTKQAPDLGPLHSCVWLMPSSPSHLCLKNMFTNVHSSTVHNC